MRFDVFAATDWSGERGAAPEVTVDLFPGPGIPEIAAADLTIERVSSAVFRHGCCIVRGLVGRDRVDVLVNDIDAASPDTTRRSGKPASWRCRPGSCHSVTRPDGWSGSSDAR